MKIKEKLVTVMLLIGLVFSLIPTSLILSQVYQLEGREYGSNEINDLTGHVIIILAAIFPVFGILIYLLARTFSSPLEKLSKLMSNVRKGEFKKISVKNTNDEMEVLGDSFNHMVQTLKKTQQENFELRKAIDESAIVAITDNKGIIKYVNDKFCEISKYSRDELIGKNHRILKSGYHDKKFYEDLWNTISNGFVWQADIKNKAKDGTFYWVQTTIVPFLDGDGNPNEYVSIRVDITENHNNIERLNEKQKIIEMQLKEIIEINKQKDEFSSMISHELKTPLIPIIGYSEMLQDVDLLGKGLNTEQSEAVTDILQNSKRLEKLISDLLETQRLEMGEVTFSLNPFNVAEFMKNAHRTLLPITKDKQIQFTNKTEITDVQINSDKDKILEIITNLVQNAVDFVKEQGTIDISVMEFGEHVLFSVSDNGSGIPEENKKTIFQKFYQVDTSISRKHGGTGLGLHICKDLVESLGGKIWFESAMNKGTIFNFTIPKNHSP